MSKLEMKLCIDSKAVITGFCYGFATANLTKLKELRNSKKLLDEKGLMGLSAITWTCMQNLSEQVKFTLARYDLKEIEELIQHGEEYLRIFRMPSE